MKINQVFLVTSCGHSDGSFVHGHKALGKSEYQIVRDYLPRITEHFEEYRIRYHVVPWEHPPGSPIKDRLKKINPDSLVLQLGVGFFDTERKHNATIISHGDGWPAKELSGMLADTLSTWGTCVSYGHRVEHPNFDANAFLGARGSFAISLAPFSINGPNSDEYLKHLGALGRDVAMTVIEYLSRTGSAVNKVYCHQDRCPL